VLTPRSILNLLGFMRCWKRPHTRFSGAINTETTSLDPKYIDDYDNRPTLLYQTYLDNYEYSDEYSDPTDDEYSSVTHGYDE
jgi:hypothetical protein